MRTLVDLHTHSTASDGALAPAVLVRGADARGLAALALTDHDTVDGLAEAREAARDLPELRFITGIEVSAQPPSGTLHLLGLGIDESGQAAGRLAQCLRDARDRRNPQIVEALRRQGLDITMDDVLAVAGGHSGQGRVVSRVHIAEALRRKHFVPDTKTAFEKYIARDRPAYVERERLGPRETISAIHDAGGVAVLAHPPQLQYNNNAHLETILRSLLAAGLNGIEVYHSDHTPAQTRHYLDLAHRFDLAITGGSDFHGPVKPEVRLGVPRVPLSVVARHPSLARLLA